MKLYSVAIFLDITPIFFAGCKKDGTGDDNSTSIVGTWELRQAQNGMTPTKDEVTICCPGFKHSEPCEK